MKLFISLILLFSALSAFAYQRATTAQKRQICQEMVKGRYITATVRTCITEADVFSKRGRNGTSIIEANYTHHYRYEGTHMSATVVCTLTPKSRAASQINCYTH